MYRSCIFCSAPLGSNDSIERFPIGRSLAFDGAKGRLWAVCGKCARWNLAPIEERWEAIEDAERLFRDTRMRAQSENIGLAKLRDGTRLVRVGGALPGELAAWRYGETLTRRRTRHLLVGAAAAGIGAVGFLVGIAGMGNRWRDRRVVQHLPSDSTGAEPVTVLRRDLEGARLVQADGEGIAIRFPHILGRWGGPPRITAVQVIRTPSTALTITGDPARTLLARAMVHVNAQGARPHSVATALRRIAEAGSPEAFLLNAARAERMLIPLERERAEPLGNLALEMALHDEVERRALDGELVMLEAMWREAEGIAAIADRLPDVPAPDPPRLVTGG